MTSGNTSGAKALNPSWDPTNPGQPTTSSAVVDVNSKTGLGTLYGDEDPYYDELLRHQPHHHRRARPR